MHHSDTLRRSAAAVAFAASIAAQGTAAQSVTLQLHQGAAVAGVQLEAAPMASVHFDSGAGQPAAAPASVAFQLDDGTAENAIGATGNQIIWLNRFTPNAADFPFQIEQIEVAFNGGNGLLVGDPVELVIFEDTDGDGDPGTGAVLLAQVSETVQALTGFSTYTLATPVRINGGGDILVGVVERAPIGASTVFPATIDQTAPQGRSWAGLWLSGTAPAVPTLPADGAWGTIDDLGFPGNWLIRASGTQVVDTPYAVAVASTRPTSAAYSDGAYTPNGSFEIGVSDGSCAGQYSLDAVAVAGSGPAGSTPPAPSPAAYAAVAAGSYSFADAGAGRYEVTVTETGTCGFDPADNPVVITAEVAETVPVPVAPWPGLLALALGLVGLAIGGLRRRRAR